MRCEMRSVGGLIALNFDCQSAVSLGMAATWSGDMAVAAGIGFEIGTWDWVK